MVLKEITQIVVGEMILGSNSACHGLGVTGDVSTEPACKWDLIDSYPAYSRRDAFE